MPEYSPSTIAAIKAVLGDPADHKIGDHIKKVIDGQIKAVAGNSSYFQAARILIEATVIDKDGAQFWKTRTEVI